MMVMQCVWFYSQGLQGDAADMVWEGEDDIIWHDNLDESYDQEEQQPDIMENIADNDCDMVVAHSGE